MTYEISINTDAQIILEATNGIVFSIFDSEWNALEEQDGKYALYGEQRYFIVASGEARNFDLTVDVDSTDSLSGEIGEYGYRFIRFSPTKSDIYVVNGIDSFEWYDNLLREHSEKLYEGETYYLKIYGESNSAYDITILRKATPISLRSYLILNSGFYSIEIEDEDEYIICIDNGNTKDVYFCIADSNNNVVYSSADASGKYNAQLAEGKYYIDIATAHSIGLLIKKYNENNGNIDNCLDINTKKNVKFSANVDNYFVFTSTSEDEYWLDISHTSRIVDFTFTVMDINSNAVSINVEQLDDKHSEVYIIKMNLEKDKQYYININYMSDETLSIDANLLIYQMKNTIYSVKLLSGDGGKEIVILQDRLEVEPQVIFMGRSYTLQAFNAEGNQIVEFNWKVSNSSNLSVLISGDNFIVEVVERYVSITLLLSDNKNPFEEPLTVNLKLEKPFILDAEFALNRAMFNPTIKHNHANINDPYDAYIEKMELTIGEVVHEINGNEYSLLKAFEEGIDIFNNNTKITCTAFIRFYNSGYVYTITKNDITIKFLRLDAIQGNALPDEKEVIIDVSSAVTSNKTLEVSSVTEKLILFGNYKTTLINVRFVFLKEEAENKKNTALFLINYNVYAYDSTVLDFSQLDNSKVYLGGENSITGSSLDYLVKAQEIEFNGEGNLRIIGNDGSIGKKGANGTSNGDPGGSGFSAEKGENGGNGTSALFCNNITSSCTGFVLLQGGKGGDGGPGGTGGFGTSGGHGLRNSGGSGGTGGQGGKGGDGGVGCSTTIVEGYIEIINGIPGCGGNGGNGGNGGSGVDASITFNQEDGAINYLAAGSGGNGGSGGSAGTCGQGEHKCRHPKGGDGGHGAPGGDGASYQDGKDYYFRTAQNGGDGGNGGSGYYGGAGGYGGRGGNGAKGKNATLTSDAEDGQRGGDGGRGGNGGNSTVSADYGGRRGYGGPGGSGGAGGDKKTVHKAGADGPDGSPGGEGNDGGYSSPSHGTACVALGTLITLADGSQVPVESLTGDETLLVWNMFTGNFDVAPILFLDKDPAREYKVINLYFSDGTCVKVIDEHGFWDFNLNRYVFLREDASRYVGHWFNKQIVDEEGNFGYTKVQLTDVIVQTEYTSAWSPVTYGHLCYYVNGMLSMPGATTGLINIFDVNPDTMTVDEDAYLADIQQYGLFTYEEFAEIYPIPEMIFEAFGGQYLKVAIGKGLLTYEDLESLIARYSVFWES